MAETSKTCERCAGPLPASRFAYCAPCAKAKRRERQAPDELIQMTRNGLMTLEEYEQTFARQKGRCAICSKRQRKALAVDHDHATGQVRGLLCSRCNLGLGQFDDDAQIVGAAASYLRHWQAH